MEFSAIREQYATRLPPVCEWAGHGRNSLPQFRHLLGMALRPCPRSEPGFARSEDSLHWGYSVWIRLARAERSSSRLLCGRWVCV